MPGRQVQMRRGVLAEDLPPLPKNICPSVLGPWPPLLAVGGVGHIDCIW